MTITGQYNGTSTYLLTTDNPIPGPPFTYVAWARPNVGGSARTIIGIAASAAATQRRMAFFEATNKLRFTAVDVAQTANSYTVNEWNLCVSIATSTTSRTVVLNSDWANRGSNTGSSTAYNFPLHVGAYVGNSTVTQFFSGEIAFECVIGDVLDEDDIRALWARVDPLRIRPGKVLWSRRFGATAFHGPAITTNNGPVTFIGDNPGIAGQ